MPVAGALAGVAQRREHDVVGRLHQRELGRRLDHPAAADDRVGADDAHAGQLLLQAVEDEEAVGLLEPDRLAGDAALAQEVGDQLQRLLILVPGADLGRDRQAFGDRRLLEEGRDDDRVAVRRDDRRRSAAPSATIGRR